MSLSIIDRAIRRAGVATQGRLKCFDFVARLVKDKKGLEIGGPSDLFRETSQILPIYDLVGSLDNCVLSKSTTWTTHSDTYVFSEKEAPGKTIFSEGSNLGMVPDHSYDFVLSSHNLEHFANPLKALKEWRRVARPGAGLIVILPNYKYTFDHHRLPTPVAHMIEDFQHDTQEEDLTHLEEILSQHDLSLDPLAGSAEAFRQRSLHNFENRCLHHHVFDKKNSRALLTQAGINVHAVEIAWPCNIFLVGRFEGAELSSN